MRITGRVVGGLIALILGVTTAVVPPSAEQASAAGSGSIAGTVVSNADGQPIEDATVWVDGPTTGQTTTGADGTYQLDGLWPGEYLVAVTSASTQNLPVAIVSCQCQPTVQRAPVNGETLLRLEQGRYRVIAGRHSDETEATPTLLEVAISPLPCSNKPVRPKRTASETSRKELTPWP